MSGFKLHQQAKMYKTPPGIGSINPLPFKKDGKKTTKYYQCIEDVNNERCMSCSRCFGSHLCSKTYREDEINVIFKEVKDYDPKQEIKQESITNLNEQENG